LSETAPITVIVPASLWISFEAAAANQGLSTEEACRRMIMGLWDLANLDLRSLPEPPKERRKRKPTLKLDRDCLDKLSEASRISGLDISSIFRRILYVILITRTICFVLHTKENGISLRIPQIQRKSKDHFRSPKPIRPQADSIERNYDPF
jgi:hypothetical protein